MAGEQLVFSIFTIFTGAAVLSTLALYTRLPMLVAYLLLGTIIGPWGLGWVDDPSVIEQIGDVGIIFLLFLLGLHLQPQNLIHMLRKTTIVALLSSLVFALLGTAVALLFRYPINEALLIGGAMMFSSTIIGLKLLPTTVLHHQHTGEIMISILLLQDLIAIVLLMFINSASEGFSFAHMAIVIIGLPALIVIAYCTVRYLLLKLLRRFDTVREYIFLVSIGWCLGLAELANLFGLTDEIGAFIAGVSLATSPIALFIAESLKPLRDFFLVIFFFSIGANFNTTFLGSVLVPAAILAALIFIVKPVIFHLLLVRANESKQVAWEVGVRLGQASEFSLLVSYLAVSAGLLSESASYLVQATTIITLIVSSYWVVLRYPTPVGFNDRLRRD